MVTRLKSVSDDPDFRFLKITLGTETESLPIFGGLYTCLPKLHIFTAAIELFLGQFPTIKTIRFAGVLSALLNLPLLDQLVEHTPKDVVIAAFHRVTGFPEYPCPAADFRRPDALFFVRGFR